MIMMPRNRIEVAELQRRSKRIAHQHLCHTLTLRIQRLKFGCEQLTKGPDMIRYPCRQCWRALSPAGTKRTGAYALVQWPRLSQAHVWSRHMIEGLEEDHALPQALAVFPFQKRVVFRVNGAKACRNVKFTRSTKAVLIVRPRGVRRSAPSTTRVLSVRSLPWGFCVTNGP